MKKHIVPMLLMLLPMLLAAGVFDGRHTLAYDAPAAGARSWRLTQQLTSYSEGGEWVPSMRVFPHYNPAHFARVDSMSMDAWDAELGWIPNAMKAYMEYDAAGNMISNVLYMNFGEMMFPMMQETVQYDAQNRVTHMYIYGADLGGSGAWLPSSRLHIVYGAGTTFQVWGWEESGDMNRIASYFHSTFTFDAQGRISEELSYTAPDSTAWVQDYKEQYQYHPQDSSTGAELIAHMSQNLAMMMMNDGYGFPGMITSTNSFYWNGTAWIPETRSSSQYDAQLRHTQMLEEYYNATTWVPENQKFYYYADNGQPSYTIGQIADSQSWVDDERIDYTWEYYSSANSDPVAPAAQMKLRAYPNPFQGTMWAEAYSRESSRLSVSIHNLRGQSLRSYQVPAGQPFQWDGKLADGSFAPAGVYFLKVKQDAATGITKVLRLK